MLLKVRKIRGKSISELRTRTGRVYSILIERIFPKLLPVAPQQTSTQVSDFLQPCFGLDDRSLAKVGSIESHHHSNTGMAIESIANGLFNFLGFEGLDFGSPPDWHYEPISGKRSPRVHWSLIDEINPAETGDKKIVWEVNRHQYFVNLGQAYRITGDEKYALNFVEHIESWFNENPPKIGVNWLSSLELAFRSIAWIWAYHFFAGSPNFKERTKQRIAEFLYLQARHIETYLSTYFAPNTHLTGEALGLYYIGSFLAQLPESARWKEKGYNILMEMLEVHIRPDGTYCEQASQYARYTADFYLDLMVLRRREGLNVESRHSERLESLCDFLMHLTQPNGRSPLIGDDDGGQYPFRDNRPIDDFRATLGVAAVLFDRGDLKFVAGERTSEIFWRLGGQGVDDFQQVSAFEPKDLAKACFDGGFFTARNNWSNDADHIVIRCGPHGFKNAGHAHADLLSFVLSLNGVPVLVDSGTFVYTGDPEARNLYRSSAAHNCLTVDGYSSSIPDGPFSWKRTANARLVRWHSDAAGVEFAGSHNGFERLGVRYQREIDFKYGGPVTVVEKITTREGHLFEVNFVLAPDITPLILGDTVELNDERTAKVVRLVGSAGSNDSPLEGEWRILDWQISPVYGKQCSTKKLVYSVFAKGEFEIACSVAAG